LGIQFWALICLRANISFVLLKRTSKPVGDMRRLLWVYCWPYPCPDSRQREALLLVALCTEAGKWLLVWLSWSWSELPQGQVQWISGMRFIEWDSFNPMVVEWQDHSKPRFSPLNRTEW
jgi:hypothetical protein